METKGMKVKKAYFVILFIAMLMPLVSACNSSTSQKNGYPNGNLLASEEDLKTNDSIIIDTRTATAYSAGHIPKAINFRWQQLETSNTDLKSIPELEAILGSSGIKKDSRIIIYDDTVNSWGASGRLFWALEYLGCTNVSILNGGWDKWIASANTPETKTNTLPATTFTASVKPAKLSDKEHIASRLNDSDFVVVDTRTDEEYIGWKLYGEAREGHIKGAVQLPYAWYYNSDKTILSKENLQNLLESHGVTKNKEVTSYCTVGIRSGFFYFLTRLMGYERTSNYDGSIKDWAADSSKPMEKADRFSTIVHPSWLKSVMDYHREGSVSAAPPEYPYDRDHKYIVFETQWGTMDDATAYKSGHIPGAFHSNSDTYENGYPRWFLLPDSELKAAVGSMGITEDTTVIVYSDSPIFAARLWWILKYAGVQDVRYLNGGYKNWTASGYQSETLINEPLAVTYTGSIKPEFIATTDYVFNNYNNANVSLADVRSYDEYIGKKSGYSYLAAKGRIPGAIWSYDADDSSSVYSDPDGSLRSFDEIKSVWEKIGITAAEGSNLFDKEVIFYCGGGYRSALTFLYGYYMGYENIRNYSEGWSGWSTDYLESDSCTDSVTPGWCQTPSGRPAVVEAK
ncbi:sulfurtransferase [Desulforegula conservatrix]|uniref:sulfurtransferase n=1 Tax=Desulforegula conservatrix TaxID=153026 RepID=UPI00040CE325|nr:rhodanese-like domain-containing protein [Desulforegula conservatrix]